MAPPTTTTAARAAYKSRSCTNVLSDREQKRLERAALLERRAWGVKEREKRRVDAARKRAEVEREEREERIKVGVKGTQRAKDRFGFRGSQRCLGVWFGDQRKTEEQMGRKLGGGGMDAEVWDETDEDNLMEGFKEPANPEEKPGENPGKVEDISRELGLAHRNEAQSVAQPHEALRHDSVLDDEWDDELLADYIPTQCARKAVDPFGRPSDKSSPRAPEPHPPSLTTSFDSIDFTEEDFDALDSTVLTSSPVKIVAERTTTTMPPPALPSRMSRPHPQRDKAKGLSRSVSLPMPARHVELGREARTPSFTMTQLESFVEEDLQLTQALDGGPENILVTTL
ncbi:hypothetical protein LTR95_010047 [Oleoguttula sp. CCFEE 5521]